MFLKLILFSFPSYYVISSVLTSSPSRVFLESIVKDSMFSKVKQNIKKTYVPKSELELEQESKLQLEQELKFEQEIKLIKGPLRHLLAVDRHKLIHGEIINWKEVYPVIRDEIIKSDEFKRILINIEKYTHSLQYKYLVFKDITTLQLLGRYLGDRKNSEMYEQLIIKVDNDVNTLNDEIANITQNVMHQVNIEFS